MALMYMTATAMPYGGSYLMHARTKGSKNGISNTPGYKAVGSRAKGVLQPDGTYLYYEEGSYNPSQRRATQAQAQRTQQNLLNRSKAQADLAYRNLRSGNLGRAARAAGSSIRSGSEYAGNSIRTTAGTAARNLSNSARTVYNDASRTAENVRSFAKTTYDSGREFITGENARAELEYRKSRVGNPNVRDQVGAEAALRKAQAAYDKTLPGKIEKAVEVGKKAWNDIKYNAGETLKKGRSFLDGIFNKVSEFGSNVFGKIKGFGEKALGVIKTAGKSAMKWGGKFIEKITGAVKTAVKAVRTGAEKVGETVSNVVKPLAEGTREFVTGEKAQAELNRVNNSISSQAERDRAEADYNRTLPGIINAASRALGTSVQAVGEAFTTASGAVVQFVQDASGAIYQVYTDASGKIQSIINPKEKNRTPGNGGESQGSSNKNGRNS